MKVLELLRELSSELQAKTNILVFASMLLVIAKALFSHVRLGAITLVSFSTLLLQTSLSTYLMWLLLFNAWFGKSIETFDC